MIDADADTELILAAEVYEAGHGDARTLADSMMEAFGQAKQVGRDREIEEVAAEKGYHSAEPLELAQALGFRAYIPEPRYQGRRQ